MSKDKAATTNKTDNQRLSNSSNRKDDETIVVDSSSAMHLKFGNMYVVWLLYCIYIYLNYFTHI